VISSQSTDTRRTKEADSVLYQGTTLVVP
jgi:hypothetical protein